MTPQAKSRLKTAIKLTVTLSLLALAFRMIRFDTLLESMHHADYSLLAASAVIIIFGGFAGAASWYCVLRTHLPEVGYRAVAACHWSGMFFNSFLPSNVGGDVVKGYIVAHDLGKVGFVVTSLLLDRVINLGMLLCIGIFTLLLQLGQRLWAAAFLVLLVGLLLGVLASARWVQDKVRRWPRAGLCGKIVTLLEPVFDLAATPQLLFPALLAAFVSQLCKTWQNIFVILALRLSIPVFCVWYVIPLFGVISALPVSIGGLGLREMVAQWLAGPMQVDNTHLVTLSVAGHLMVVLVNMLGVLPFLLRRHLKQFRLTS
jgi:uncharacterized membrane protein YbhN (UPF0104 family)